MTTIALAEMLGHIQAQAGARFEPEGIRYIWWRLQRMPNRFAPDIIRWTVAESRREKVDVHPIDVVRNARKVCLAAYEGLAKKSVSDCRGDR